MHPAKPVPLYAFPNFDLSEKEMQCFLDSPTSVHSRPATLIRGDRIPVACYPVDELAVGNTNENLPARYEMI